ncbi:hypothetical protein H6G64_35425 [Calothrix sp. FACHB-156]|nr:hypothetical protein [Calothrix sp. FACHB-156]
MTRSIEQIATGKTTQELRKEAVALLRKTKIPFVQQGIERTPSYIQSNGRKQDCIEYISLVETTLAAEENNKQTTVQPKQPVIEPTPVKTPKTTAKTRKTAKNQPVEAKETVTTVSESTTTDETSNDEPSPNYSNSEDEKLSIAKVIYESTAKKDDLTGLREYHYNLCKTQKYFLPEFAILVARTRVLIEHYSNAKSPDAKAHPGTVQKNRVDVMRYLEGLVKPEIDKFLPVNDRTLLDTFNDFQDAVRGAFNDIGKIKYELNRKKNEAAEIDVRAINVAPFIEWAIEQVNNLPESPARWKEVAIAVMLLTGRRQSEVMSSGIFTYADNTHVVFEGQLKRHVDELVAPEKIPVLGKAAKGVDNAIKWLEKHGKRTVPEERTPELIKKAAKKSHDRCSRYIAETIDNLTHLCPILNGKEWKVSVNGKNVSKFTGHTTRQIYAQVCSGLFHDSNESKKRAYISQILLENRDAALIYDRDIEVKDLKELRKLCGSIS